MFSMASHMQDDFEFVDLPMRDRDSIISQPARPSWEVERASERAIEPLIEIMQKSARELLAISDGREPIFHTATDSLDEKIAKPIDIPFIIFETFVGGIPGEHRGIMNCTACKRFMRQYGDLSMVGDDGLLVPLMWPQNLSDVPEYYRQSVANVLKLFHRAITGDEFQPKKNRQTIGTPNSSVGEWHHMSLTFSKDRLRPSGPMPMDSQDTETSFAMLDRILSDNNPEIIARVHHLITGNQLPYTTSHKAPIKYLKATSDALSTGGDVKDPVKHHNLITKHARSAFPGCLSSLRGGMVGYLFECVRADQPFEELKRNWISKADPLSYLRPTAAPTVGNIESAEKIFARLGYTPRDLERQFLALDQVPGSAILWSPPPASTPKPEEESNGPKLFGHLIPLAPSKKQQSYLTAPLQQISFRSFALKVLPTTVTMHLMPSNPIQAYFFTTGKADTKPIMSFHNSGSHTASWYTWGSKSHLKYAGLKEEWTEVTKLITFPHMWDEFTTASESLEAQKQEEFKHKRHGIRFLFCLKGARDTQGDRRGTALFPTLIRGEFHSVRSTVEACSRAGKLGDWNGKEEGMGCVGGVSVEKDKERHELVVGVRNREGLVSRYQIVLFE